MFMVLRQRLGLQPAPARARLRGLLLPVLAALAAAAAWATPASGSPSTKNYEAAVSPTTVYVLTPTEVTLTLSDDPASNQSFASTQVSFGTLTSTGPAPEVAYTSNNLGWAEALVKSSPATFQLTSETGQPAVAPGGQISVSFSLDVPTPGTIAVSTQVKQSNDFLGTNNQFALQGLPPSVTVASYLIAFSQEPPSELQQSDPAAGKFSYICPPVAVALSTASGQPAPAGIPVTIVPSANPGLYFGTAPVASETLATGSNGTAIFGTCSSGFASTNLGTGFSLTASAGAASVTSSPFSVAQSVQQCPGSCSSPQVASNIMEGTTGKVSASNNENAGFELASSFGEGLLLQCDSYVVGHDPADPFLSSVAGSPASGSVTSGVVTLFFPKAIVNELPNNGTPLMPVCAGAAQPFLAKLGVAPSSTSPFQYQGLLYDCDDPTYTAEAGSYPLQMCVASRSKSAANETVVVDVSSLTDDPMWL
jgi:hypothetical protein